MRVICLADSAAHLPAKPAAYNPDAVLPLAVGAGYQVHGIALYAGVLMVLLRDETGLPNWFPLRLFEVHQHQLPIDWKFTLVDEDSPYLQALWGYPELTDDQSHYDKLLERDGDAVRIFLERADDDDDDDVRTAAG